MLLLHPAYDVYFVSAVKEQGIIRPRTGKKDYLEGLVNFYKGNAEKLENCRAAKYVDGLKYPQMNILDMGFWELGKPEK